MGPHFSPPGGDSGARGKEPAGSIQFSPHGASAVAAAVAGRVASRAQLPLTSSTGPVDCAHHTRASARTRRSRRHLGGQRARWRQGSPPTRNAASDSGAPRRQQMAARGDCGRDCAGGHHSTGTSPAPPSLPTRRAHDAQAGGTVPGLLPTREARSADAQQGLGGTDPNGHVLRAPAWPGIVPARRG